MHKKSQVTFEEIRKQNGQRIHFHMQQLRNRDPHREFYQKGLAIWSVCETFQPDKGVLSTYFNFIIRKRVVDLLRGGKTKEEHIHEVITRVIGDDF